MGFEKVKIQMKQLEHDLNVREGLMKKVKQEAIRNQSVSESQANQLRKEIIQRDEFLKEIKEKEIKLVREINVVKEEKRKKEEREVILEKRLNQVLDEAKEKIAMKESELEAASVKMETQEVKREAEAR